MSVVARRVRATPERSAADTWRFIIDLVATKAGEARTELENVAGLAGSSITSETLREAPVVMSGVGPRVRIYCLYGEDAIVGDDASEDRLAFDPTAGDWTMSLPCPDEDFEWFSEALRKRSKRVIARKASADAVSDKAERSTSAKSLEPNREKFLKS